MNDKTLSPEIPFIWPEARVLEEVATYWPDDPFQNITERANGIFGVVSCIDESGVEYLNHLLRSSEILVLRLIIAVYGACGTESNHLERLLEIQNQYPDRAMFSIFTTEISYTRGTPTNLLCCIDKQEYFIQTGSTTNFGAYGAMDAQVNLVFKAEASLMNEIRKWFEYLWHRSAPLTESTSGIPELVPARGTEEAEEMWRRYLEECEKAKGVDKNQNLQLTIDPETGEVTATDAEGNVVASPSTALDLKPLDAVGGRIAKLYQQGSVVTIDKATRIPPLEAPIKAEWFGMETLRQIGTVTRQTQYKITLFDERTMKDIDNKRKTLRPLINAFSFPISDGVAWMPAKARDLFEQHVIKANKDGKNVLSDAVGNDKDKFVHARMGKIIGDANKMYQEVTRSSGSLPDDIISDIVKDLKQRLDKAFSGSFLPQVSYMSVSFSAGSESEVTSPWGQALSLLEKIVRLPREIYSDPFKMRGIQLAQEQYASAMNVLDDALLRHLPEKEPSSRECKQQLSMIEEIMDLEFLDQKQKCFLLLALIDGVAREEFDKMLSDFVVEAHKNEN